MSFDKDSIGTGPVEIVVGDDASAKQPLQRHIVKGRHRRAGRIAFDDVQVGGLGGQTLRNMIEERLGIAVIDVVSWRRRLTPCVLRS